MALTATVRQCRAHHCQSQLLEGCLAAPARAPPESRPSRLCPRGPPASVGVRSGEGGRHRPAGSSEGESPRTRFVRKHSVDFAIAPKSPANFYEQMCNQKKKKDKEPPFSSDAAAGNENVSDGRESVRGVFRRSAGLEASRGLPFAQRGLRPWLPSSSLTFPKTWGVGHPVPSGGLTASSARSRRSWWARRPIRMAPGPAYHAHGERGAPAPEASLDPARPRVLRVIASSAAQRLQLPGSVWSQLPRAHSGPP